jgi:hypothetical protein
MNLLSVSYSNPTSADANKSLSPHKISNNRKYDKFDIKCLFM